ncbi:MAG: carboxymuconolactone decarboxylase family protein [Chloroflexota bacterium]|nr:MAG: carboxymuconolactone decarboxylase family protein [Chloroflexota bacterium]
MSTQDVMKEETRRKASEVMDQVWGAQAAEVFGPLAVGDDSFDKDVMAWWSIIFQRPGLDLKTRLLICLAAVTVQDRLGFMRGFITAALNAGCSETEVRETIVQVHLLGGFPTSRNALIVLSEVLEERAGERERRPV